MNQEIIYQAMIKICKEQGKDFRQYTSSEFLEDIEKAIVKISSNYWLKLETDKNE